MNHRMIVLAGLLATSILALSEPLTAKPKWVVAEQPMPIAQDAEPEDLRISIAEVDPEQPIQIRVVNESDIDVDIASALKIPPSDVRVAAPGESVTFGRLHTSFLPPPLELTLFVREIDIVLENIDVEVENNEIIISVKAQRGSAGTLRVIDVSESGNIYLD